MIAQYLKCLAFGRSSRLLHQQFEAIIFTGNLVQRNNVQTRCQNGGFNHGVFAAIEAEEVPAGAINVGWNQTTTLKQVLEALVEVVGDLPAVSYTTARSGDIRHSRANNQRLLASFKLPEPTPMKVGLARLLQL